MYWNFANQAFIFEFWAEAADIDSVTLDALMQAAHEVCTAYAPALSEGAIVPHSWRIAEIEQARHVWSQATGGNGQEFGPDGLSMPSYPLVFAARDLLRPKSSPLGRLR